MRAELVHTCFQQIQNLNPELIEVKLRRQYVEKYKKEDAFLSLSEEDKTDLIKEIAPLVQSPESDEFAKRFDNFIYGMMLAHIEQMPLSSMPKNSCATPLRCWSVKPVSLKFGKSCRCSKRSRQMRSGKQMISFCSSVHGGNYVD